MTAIDLFFDELVEAVADRVAKKLQIASQPVAPTFYTTDSHGPHFPGKSLAWMRKNAKRVPGARKAGRYWVVSAADYDAWVLSTTPPVKGQADAPPPPASRPRSVKLTEATDDAILEARADRALRAHGFRKTVK